MMVTIGKFESVKVVMYYFRRDSGDWKYETYSVQFRSPSRDDLQAMWKALSPATKLRFVRTSYVKSDYYFNYTPYEISWEEFIAYLKVLSVQMLINGKVVMVKLEPYKYLDERIINIKTMLELKL